MSTRSFARTGFGALVAAFAAAATFAAAAQAQEGPGLGVVATPEQVAGWDISIGPGGTGLPPGSGTAVAGKVVYEQKCLACHGVEGAGQPNDQLVGGQGTLASSSPVRTVGSYWPYATTLFDYIRRAMPFTAPQSLANDEVYALTAYLLHLNGIVAETVVIDAMSLPKVAMPNRDNFIVSYSDGALD